HPLQPILVEDKVDPSGARRDFLRQIVDGRTEPAIDDDRVGALGRQSKRGEQLLTVIPDGRPPARRQPEILDLLAHIAEVGVDDLAGQNLVAGADDLNAHASTSSPCVDSARCVALSLVFCELWCNPFRAALPAGRMRFRIAKSLLQSGPG